MTDKTPHTVIQLNDSHAYVDLHQEMFWQGVQAVYCPAGGCARIATTLRDGVVHPTRAKAEAGDAGLLSHPPWSNS